MNGSGRMVNSDCDKLDLYDYICTKVNSSVKKTDLKQICRNKSILMFGSTITKAMNNFYETCCLGSCEICYVVCQQQMQPLIEQWNKDKFKVIHWNGKYDDKLESYLTETINMKELEAFVYFSRQAVNARDVNILRISVNLQQKFNIKIYCVELFGDEYEIEDINAMYQGVKLYQDINNFLNL